MIIWVIQQYHEVATYWLLISACITTWKPLYDWFLISCIILVLLNGFVTFQRWSSKYRTCRGLITGMAEGQAPPEGWMRPGCPRAASSRAGRGYEGLLSGEATCKERDKALQRGWLEVDELYTRVCKGKSGPWKGRRMAYPLTTGLSLVNPTGLDYCI